MPARTTGVVVVNWNGYADTLTCLDSLESADPRPAQVAVVDNGSTDDSVAILNRWRTSHALPVSILASATNRGFSGANNLGVTHLAESRMLTRFLLLNNDATVSPDFFAQLGRALESVPDAAIVGPTIYVTGRANQVWYAGGGFVPLRGLVIHHLAVPAAPDPIPTEFVTGCAMLISRAAWETLGPLPESYFIYFEDAEYSWRARAARLPVLYAPRAVAYHAVGTAMQRSYSSPWVERLQARNRALFVRRNFAGWARWGALGYLIATKPARAAIEAIRGRPRLGWAVLCGTIEGLLSKDGQRDIRQSAAVQPAHDGVRIYE